MDTTQDEKDNTTNAFFNTLTRLSVEPNLAMKIAINDANEKFVKQVLGILGEYQDKFTNLFKEL